MPEVGCNIAMFFLKVFGHFDFLLQVLGQEADSGGSVWVRYLKPWNWDGKQAWKWEDAASYLMECQVPAADVLRKMEDVQLHDDGNFCFLHFQLRFRFSHWDRARKCSVFSQLWCCFSFKKKRVLVGEQKMGWVKNNM